MSFALLTAPHLAQLCVFPTATTTAARPSVEYALLLALIAIVLVVAVTALGETDAARACRTAGSHWAVGRRLSAPRRRGSG